jgi:hypothetical protein
MCEQYDKILANNNKKNNNNNNNKGTMSLSLLNYVLCHEDLQRNGSIVPPILTSEVGGGEWQASRLCYFTPGKKPAVPLG